MELIRLEEVSINENPPTPRRSVRVTEEKPVGFEDDIEKIIHLLTRGTKDLDVISIFGMPGLGKTTLATKIFNESPVISHFDVRVSCTISQMYNVRELLIDIHKKATGISLDNYDDIADTVRKFLIGKRYLIFLDDIWDSKVWEELRLSFPNRGNGSRVMLTTRLDKVAREVKLCADPYPLRFLAIEESWKLLQKRVFRDQTCPPEFRDVGLQLAKHCGGLPLAIVLIGGIIAKGQRNVSEWCEVANNLKFHFGEVGNESNTVIELSYQNLPDHLRHCLLTMGIFREDEKIDVFRLMLLWMAEGSVQCTAERGMEEVAEGSLMDLISSSLVMVRKTTINGKAKYLQIHDLVRDFIITKAKEEKFMHVIGSHNEYQPSLDDEEHRVCIHCDQGDDYISKPYLLHSHAFLKKMAFGSNKKSVFVTEGASDFLDYTSLVNLRLLRVLDLAKCTWTLTDYKDKLQSFIHLRYLRMHCEEFSFEWVSHLCHLETLLLDSDVAVESFPMVVVETSAIRYMAKLRHVNLGKVAAILTKMTCGEPFKLENLRTFKGMVLLRHDNLEETIECFPNLQKLSLAYIKTSSLAQCSNSNDQIDFPSLKLEILSKLQSLALSMGLWHASLREFYLPLSLKELTLHGVVISRYTTSAIARLPNLEKLKFENLTFEQNEWDVRDVEFRALKCLKLCEAKLMQWHASESSFPVLEILQLKDCWYLKKIPCSFVDVQMLKLIKVIVGSNTLERSALEIKEEVELITGSDNLKVYIYPPSTLEMKNE